MVEHPKCARCGLTITQFHVCPVRETPLERQHRDLSPIPLYPSESPTHPDAPRAGGETPTPQERYERLLAEKLKWFEEAAASDRALHALTDDATLSEALGEIRHFAPAAMHWALNLAMSRLLARHRDGERLDWLERAVPSGEFRDFCNALHNQWPGSVRQLIDAAMSAPPSPERASK